MSIKSLFKKEQPVFSFEFFPPKTSEAEESLYRALDKLKPLAPSFISVTCGAMGTTRDKTAEMAAQIKEKLGCDSMAHLTCVAFNRHEMKEVLGDLKKRGVDNVLALRGDPPKGEKTFERPKDGFSFAEELVIFIRNEFGNAFSVGVAAYPEVHVECRDADLNLQHLKQKVDAGADFVITQLFFLNQNFFEFVDNARKAGIQVPIVPGIMPLTNANQIKIFGEQCGVVIPPDFQERVSQLAENKQELEEYGIEFATRQCEELLNRGVPGIHFYTLNRSKATKRIFENLKIRKRFPQTKDATHA